MRKFPRLLAIEQDEHRTNLSGATYPHHNKQLLQFINAQHPLSKGNLHLKHSRIKSEIFIRCSVLLLFPELLGIQPLSPGEVLPRVVIEGIEFDVLLDVHPLAKVDLLRRRLVFIRHLLVELQRLLHFLQGDAPVLVLIENIKYPNEVAFA